MEDVEARAVAFKQARTCILVAALLTLFYGIYTPIAFGLHASLGIWATPALGLALLGIWWWSARDTFHATVTALALYIVVTVAQAVAEPSLVVTGGLSLGFRSLLLVLLGMGMASALRYRKLTDKAV